MAAEDTIPAEGAEQVEAPEVEGTKPEVVEAEVIEEVEGEAVDDELEGNEVAADEAASDEAEEAPVDELAKAKEEAVAMRDRYLRLQAEWDNYRKRTATEREQEKVRASEKLVKDLIPVIDDMERALEHAKDTGEGGTLTDGVDAILTKFLQILAKSKVEQIEAVGEPFDPMKHQAVGTQPDDTVPEETVVNVYQKGYMMGDRVLRPAMVVTSTK